MSSSKGDNQGEEVGREAAGLDRVGFNSAV